MTILAIETSCDETAIALVEAEGGLSVPRFRVVRDVVASQVKVHAPFGGVVPSLAKREHIRNLPILLRRVVSGTLKVKSIDAVVVTVGPGLEPALWTGIEFAKKLAAEWKKPIIGASHLEGHLYSFLLGQKTSRKSLLRPGFGGQVKVESEKLFPVVALIVSGGHTILVLMKNLKEYKKLGETLDDAAGESFDKVARLLGLGYPGGPALEKLARSGNPDAIPFPSPMIHQKNYNFSYSGLKTAVLYYMRDHSDAIKADIAASFQRAAFEVVVKKTARAAREFGARTVVVGGGVAANRTLVRMMRRAMRDVRLSIPVVVPPMRYCMDNAVMIAAAAYIDYVRGKKHPLRANGTLSL